MVTEADRDEFQRLGDINRDGIIEFDDAYALYKAFGSRAGDANWDARCDLDGDGQVTILDADKLQFHMLLTIEAWILSRQPPPPTYIYTLKITFLKMFWFNQAAFEGAVERVTNAAIPSIIDALGYTCTYLGTTIDYKNSTVDVSIKFSAASPAVTAAVLTTCLLAVGLIVLGMGLVAIGIAWYRQAEAQIAHEVTVQEAQSQLNEALAAGLITSEQYTEIMKKLQEQPAAGINWQNLLIIGLVGVGAIVLLPKVLPERKG